MALYRVTVITRWTHLLTNECLSLTYWISTMGVIPTDHDYAWELPAYYDHDFQSNYDNDFQAYYDYYFQPHYDNDFQLIMIMIFLADYDYDFPTDYDYDHDCDNNFSKDYDSTKMHRLFHC